MCGIAGIVSANPSGEAAARVKKAALALAHRGPEAEGFWANAEGTVHLGHRRLCILDLSGAAAQPMHEADRYTLLYNGEIYNYLELRTALEKEGRTFRSQSDTEVLLAAYAAWGPHCLDRLDGMFAFAVWDQREQTLFAARDRFGEKPLFFFYDGDQLVFASELKALWAAGLPKAVNEAMLYNFLTIGYTANPADGTETFYRNLRKLPAAHSLTYSLRENSLQLHRYWQVYPEVAERIGEAEAAERFQQLFADSVGKRLRSDVPIGTSLSGGMDSSAIVAACAQRAPAQYVHKAFTASFAGFEKDEAGYAQAVAERYGLQHFLTTVREEEVPGLMDAVTAAQDEPFSSASALAQYKVFAMAKEQGVTVLLDGQGADEMLAGYHRYYRWYWQELYRGKALRRSQELATARALGVSENFGLKDRLAAMLPELAAALLQSQKAKTAFRHPDLNRDFAFAQKQSLYYALPAHPTLNGALYHNAFVNGLEELLRLADRNAMANSLEVRLPFLQRELAEFLFRLPPHFKIRHGWTKWLLRKAVEGRLPAGIVWRKDKVGYEPPQKRWMQNGAVRERIGEAKKTLVAQGILHPSALRRPVVPRAAHEAGGFDWRYWSAAALFG